ncbi:MAG: hypothetical protein CJBNEKGG_04287 [Prosthecobacter sp.]|nr:hypothetical protein [Prosthecobacter sp.]
MPFPSQVAYQSSHGCTSWQGERAVAGDELNAFLSGPVAARLNDTEGGEELRSHLRGLSLTGMGHQALEEVLAADEPEERDWAVGEALAEAILEEHHDVVLPWNTERDKRNPFASLPGADIVGFQRDGDSHRLALGEVKCSSEEQWPPQVMSGRSGRIGHQLDALASNLGTICQLLKWLLPRVKGTTHEGSFNNACSRYFNSSRRDVTLFGILIRDKDAREQDLQARGRSLGRSLQAPTHCQLLALYLPWPISDLPTAIRQGGAS